MSRKKAKQRSKAISVSFSGLKENGLPPQAKADLEIFSAQIKERFLAERYRDVLNEWSKAPVANRPSKLDSLIAEAHFRLGLDCYRNPTLSPDKRVNLIVSELSQATAINPEKAIYHFHMGLAYEHLGNLKKARVSYRRAVELDSANDRFLFHYVMACLKSDQAQMALEMLVSCKPSFVANFSQFLLKMKQGKTPSFAELNGIYFPLPDEAALFKGLLSLKHNLVDQASYYFESSLDEAEESGNPMVAAFSAFFLGKIYYHSRDKSRQDQMLKLALDSGLDVERYRPELIAYCWYQGIEAAKMHHLEESRKYFEAMLTLAPGNAAAQKNLQRLQFLAANKLAHAGNWQEALTIWQMMCAKDDLNAFHNIALAYDKLENPEKASVHWQKVSEYYENLCRRNPTDPPHKEYLIIAYQHLLHNYRESGNDNRAIKTLQKMCDLQPDNLEMHYELAELLIDNEKLSSARRHLEHILQRQPGHISALLNLAFVQEMAEEIPQAIKTLETILTLDADNGEARQQLGELLNNEAFDLMFSGRDIEKAGSIFNRLIELNPRDFGAYLGWANIFLREYDDPKSVDRIFKQYIDTDPDDPIVYINIANAYLDFNMPKKANAYLNQSEKVTGDNPMLLFELGKAVYSRSPRQADLFFQKATNSDPNNAGLYYQIGSWLGMRNPLEGKKYLENCLRIDKYHIAARADLALVYSLLGQRKKAAEHMLYARQAANESNSLELTKELDAMDKMLDEQLELFADDFFEDEP